MKVEHLEHNHFPRRLLVYGPDWATLRNAHKTGFLEGPIRPRFWPATQEVFRAGLDIVLVWRLDRWL
jgi:hypothetical protein